MASIGRGQADKLEAFRDADAAVARISELYQAAVGALRERYRRFLAGERRGDPPAAHYPFLSIEAGPDDLVSMARPAYGSVRYPGMYGTTLTRPDLFANYYCEQIGLLLRHHRVPVYVGTSDRAIPLPFVIEEATADLRPEDLGDLSSVFHLPNLGRIDDDVANGTFRAPPGQSHPLALFSAERVDLGLQRLYHYTGTDPAHFQSFVLFTNYQRYVDDFVAYGHRQLAADSPYTAFVEPTDRMTTRDDSQTKVGQEANGGHLPAMPAYHLVRPDGLGITLVNIGFGPSNAKTVTDHLAVLRPHCWLMIGHCGGLRRSQKLGDYVLAHAYIREDHVLDRDLPLWIPVPPIAEVQVALQEAVARVTGLRGNGLKTHMRTGTVATTDNRNWELRFAELYERFSQSRAIAVDMESATIAANGFRFRVPYGTLLCVSDKPMHGELKLRSQANAFYRNRVSQHLTIGLEAIQVLQESGIDALHSRKLRSFDEPPFR